MPSTTRSGTRKRCSKFGSLLDGLSDDLIFTIFSHLDAVSLKAFTCTSERFSRVASDDALWKLLLKREMAESMLPAAQPTCRRHWCRRYWRWRTLGTRGSCSAQKLACLCSPTSDGYGDRPEPRYLHRVASLCANSLYVFGGQGGDHEHDDLWRLELSTPSSSSPSSSQPPQQQPPPPRWRRLVSSPSPSRRQAPTLTAVGDRLLMFGGRQTQWTAGGFSSGQRFLNDLWAFEPEADRWSCLSHGDEDQESDPHAILELDPQDGASARPCPRWAHSAVAFGHRLLLFGGSAPGCCFRDLRWYDSGDDSWRSISINGLVGLAWPAERSGHSCVGVGAFMYLFGGNTSTRAYSDLWRFDTETSLWALLRPAGAVPTGRVGHTLTAMGHRILVLGGRNFQTNTFDDSLHSCDGGRS